MVAQHTQCLGRMTGYQHALAMSQEMPDQIGDGTTLAGAGRPLDQNRAVPIQLLCDAELFLVGFLTEEHVPLAQDGSISGLIILVWGFAADNVGECVAEVLARLNALYHLSNGGAESLGPRAQEQQGATTPRRVLPPLVGAPLVQKFSL